MTTPLRLMVYDRTCTKYGAGLSTAWRAGGRLYQSLERLDATYGAATWSEALSWLATYETSAPIAEIQYWGHGKWGCAFIANDRFDASALREGHPLFPAIAAVRDRLVRAEGLFWLRCCECFGAAAGLDFAERLADTLGARVAGHTYIIGAIQSGLHGLLPGTRARWSAAEGIARGTPELPERAHGSSLFHPNTITCFHGAVPEGFY